MSKFLVFLMGLLILGGVGYFYMHKNDYQPADPMETSAPKKTLDNVRQAADRAEQADLAPSEIGTHHQGVVRICLALPGVGRLEGVLDMLERVAVEGDDVEAHRLVLETARHGEELGGLDELADLGPECRVVLVHRLSDIVGEGCSPVGVVEANV